MGRAIDPSVRILVERLVDLDDGSGRMAVREGEEGSHFVGHLAYGRPPFEFSGVEFEFQALVDVYISRQGTQLLTLAAEARREIDNENLRDIAIFAEISPDSSSGLVPDQFSSLVRDIAVNPRLAKQEIIGYVEEMRKATRILELIPFPKSQIFTLLEQQRIGRQSTTYAFIDAYFEAGAFVMYKLADAADGIAGFLESNSKMPEDLWKPGRQPAEFQRILDGLRTSINKRLQKTAGQIKALKLELADLVPTSIAPMLPDFLIDRLKSVIKIWNSALGVVERVINELKGIGSDIKESVETVLGFISGVWDGIMDAVIGLFQIIGLAGRVFALYMTAKRPLERMQALLLEAADEVMQALSRVDWERVWQWFEANASRILAVIVAQAESFIDHATRSSAQAAYYFGYLVYIVVETFFPPLKATSIARHGRRLAAADFFGRLFN